MTPSTTAARKERPPRSFWFDPRLAIGFGLVIASMIGVFVVVGAADDTVLVYAAKSSLTVGDHIGADDLVEQGVALGSLTDSYLTRDELPDAGLVVTRTVAAGELVPSAAVGSEAGIRVASVVVTIASQLPQSIGAGALVDVWAAREVEGGGFGPPSVLVSSATVVRVIEAEGIIAGAKSVDVELLVPRSKTARALESIANADALSLVPVSIPAKG